MILDDNFKVTKVRFFVVDCNYSSFQSVNFIFTPLHCVILYKVSLNKNLLKKLLLLSVKNPKYFFLMYFRMKAIIVFPAISYNSFIAFIASYIALGSASSQMLDFALNLLQSIMFFYKYFELIKLLLELKVLLQ